MDPLGSRVGACLSGVEPEGSGWGRDFEPRRLVRMHASEALSLGPKTNLLDVPPKKSTPGIDFNPEN